MRPLLPVVLFAIGCSSDPSPPPGDDLTPLALGESRTVELRFLRFDVSNYETAMTKADLLALPQETRERMWLLDIDLTSAPSAPRLLENAIVAIQALDPATLSPAARNLQRLLIMTPDSADLRGTNLEKLIGLAPLVGISPARVLADLLKIDVEDTFLPPTIVAEAIRNGVIATHPNARTRLGPKTRENQAGLYPVMPGALPLSLEDVLTDGASLSRRYGEITQNGVYHPGFIAGTTKIRATGDDFKIKVRVNANALPYKGVDLGSASRASVNSVPSQMDTLFDFEDPRWIAIEGLVGGSPIVESLTFRTVESPLFFPGGRLPTPTGEGSSPAWQAPPWTLERVVLGAARDTYAAIDGVSSYTQPGMLDPLVAAEVTKGWQSIKTKEGIGSPPPPSYLWDILLEVAQVRLHDGGLTEGNAGAEISLHDIPLGFTTAEIEKTVRDNLRADPAAFVDVATKVIDTSSGDADFYYYRADPRKNEPAKLGDYLFFVADGDLGSRPFRYAHPGFYRDEALTEKASTKDALDDDVEHEKVRMNDGDVVYVEDDDAKVFKVTAEPKSTENRRTFTIARVR